MLYLLLATYGTVLLAEMLGDKSIYTIGSLTTRFDVRHVLAGISLAFAGKMLVAVLVGRAIAQLPPSLIAGVSAVTFLATALVIWFRKPERRDATGAQPQFWTRAVFVSFAAIFFTEWGDVGQIAAATLAARYREPFVVWLAATAALVTKGLLAITLGVELRKRVSPRYVRYGAVMLCLAMGILAAFHID
jgi:putative Ca2+/H+ antiporter (TMEM165/GDT1 family)